MGLKAIVEDLDSVDEAVKGLYVESDGKFRLDVEAVDGIGIANVKGLEAVNADIKKQRDELKGKIKSNQSAQNDLKLQIAELEAGKTGDLDERLAKLKADMTTLHQEEIGKHVEEKNGLMGQLRELKVTSTLKDALISLGATANGAKLLPEIIGKDIQLGDDGNVVIVDNNGNVRSGTSGNMTVAERALEAKNSLPEFFNGDSKSGGGSKGTGQATGVKGAMKVSDFNKMKPKERAAFMNEGGQVTD